MLSFVTRLAGDGRGMDATATPLPSALSHMGRFRHRLRDKRAIVFLDYDGTLTPIVSRPELAQISPEMKALVGALADRCVVAIVSGRSRATLTGFLGLENVIYAGSHGMDIAGPLGTSLRLDAGREFRETMEGVRRRLSTALSSIPGTLVELNTYTVTAHYRLVYPKQIPLVEAVVDRELLGYPNLRKVRGKMIWDIRPNVPWDKGKAILWIREQLGLHFDDSVAFYLGDDTTDEDAFAVLEEPDVGILVAHHPRKTAARYCLRDPSEVGQFLEGLIGVLDDSGG